MDIWEYTETAEFISSEAFSAKKCIYCNTKLDIFPANYDSFYQGKEYSPESGETLTKVAACPMCGWWKLHQITADDDLFDFHDTPGAGIERFHREYGAIGSLKELDLRDLRQPIEEVRQYLAAKYSKRFSMHPRLFEETVASVFRDLGYSARVTAYSKDDGIDVILDGTNDSVIGVQVKRYRNSIKVEQIRSLSGALFIGGYTKGIFITTSYFQRGAQRTADFSDLRGIAIELIDAKKFYEALRIAQRKRYTSQDKDAPFLLLPPSKLIQL